MQESGCALLTVHGRQRRSQHANRKGPADLEEVLRNGFLVPRNGFLVPRNGDLVSRNGFSVDFGVKGARAPAPVAACQPQGPCRPRRGTHICRYR